MAKSIYNFPSMAPLIDFSSEKIDEDIIDEDINEPTSQLPEETLTQKLLHPEGKYNFLMDMDRSELDPYIQEKMKTGHIFQGAGLFGLKILEKTTEMAKMLATGTQRVAGEAIVDIQKPFTGKKTLPIKNKLLQTFLGTQELVPIGDQFKQMYERYGYDAVTALAGVFLKTTEGIGAMAFLPAKSMPLKTKRGNYIVKNKTSGAISIKENLAGIGAGEKVVLQSAHSGASISSAIEFWKEPFIRNTVGRLMRKETSPTVKFVGEKEFLAMNKLGKDIPNGVSFAEQAKYAELYARQMVFEESVEGHYPAGLEQFKIENGKRVPNPAYWKEVLKVSDDKVSQMLARSARDPKQAIYDGYNNFHNNAELEGLNLRDLVSTQDTVSGQFLKDIEVAVQEKINQKEFQAILDQQPPKNRAKLKAEFEQSVREYYYKNAQEAGQEKGGGIKIDRSEIKTESFEKPVQDVAAVRMPAEQILERAEIWISERGWLDKGYAIGSKDLFDFFEEFPDYSKFTPRIYEIMKKGGKEFSQAIIKNILNPEINLLHFKEGTPGFQKEMNLKSTGWGIMEGPETMRGDFAEQQKIFEAMGYKDMIKPGNPKLIGDGKATVNFETPAASILEKGRRMIRDVIAKTGFSPEGTNRNDIIMAINKRFADQLKKGGYETIASQKGKMTATFTIDEARRKLFQYANETEPSGNLDYILRGMEHPFYRLKAGEITQALGVDNATAQALQKAIATSRNIEAELAGGALKAVNVLRYGNIPIASKLYNNFINFTLWAHFPSDPFMQLRYIFKSNVLTKFNKGPVNLGTIGYKIGAGANKITQRFPVMERLGFKGFFGTKPKAETYQLHDSFMEGKIGEMLDPANEMEVLGGSFKGAKERMFWLRRMGVNIKDMEINLLETFAKSRGFTSKLPLRPDQQFDVINQLSKFPELRMEAQELISNVFHYGDKGYLQSPMAKSLNVLAYPSRFSTKVLILTNRWLDSLPPLAQNMMVNQLGQYILWTRTDEAKDFYKKNWRWLDAVKWINPYSHISETFENLFEGKLGNLGMAGGIPAGFFFDLIPKELGLRKNIYTSMETGEPKQQHLFRGVNRQIAVDFFSGIFRSVFSYPFYTLSNPLVSAGILEKPLHSPTSLISDYLGKTAGTIKYGQSNILNKYVIPRPERLVPEDMDEPWKWLLEQMTLDSLENPGMYGK